MFAYIITLKSLNCSYLMVRGNPKIKYFPKDENWKYLYYNCSEEYIKNGKLNLQIVTTDYVECFPLKNKIENEVEMFKEFCESVKKIEEMNSGGEKNDKSENTL